MAVTAPGIEARLRRREARGPRALPFVLVWARSRDEMVSRVAAARVEASEEVGGLIWPHADEPLPRSGRVVAASMSPAARGILRAAIDAELTGRGEPHTPR